jgi:NAD(P)-dependent dehydrogenase (short-subunit alcohol dehydrogenase family)
MVLLHDVQASNSSLASTLPGLVAVFVGATSGIGEFTLKQFAKHASKPRVYFIGRSEEAGDRIAAECTALNSEGKFIFIKADTSLIRNVDDVSRDIKSKEQSINILFLSAGTLIQGTSMVVIPLTCRRDTAANLDIYIDTSEGLDLSVALKYYCRARFIVNLLPLLQHATYLRRVVSVAAGTKEGPVDTTDFQEARSLSILGRRAHFTSFITISHTVLAEKAPQVSFVHDFPGAVKTGIFRGSTGVVSFMIRTLLKVLGPFIYIPSEESGERHLFLATSATYPAGLGSETASGIPLVTGVAVARGIDGKDGSGVYSVDQSCESAGPAVEELLAKMKKDGVLDQVWGQTENLFKQITGLEAV